MNKIYVPLNKCEDWQKLLAHESHWKDNYSAKLTAEAWCSAVGFPTQIHDAMQKAGAPFNSFEPQLILPEHQVAIPPDGRRPTQCDVWVLASHATGLASIAVEGKKEESFGPNLGEWREDASAGKIERLDFLTQLLGLSSPLPDSLRYQFLHRSAGAILEAKRFRASIAVLLIQSFSDANAGLKEYQDFVGLFGQTATQGKFVLLPHVKDVAFYVAWIRQ